MKDRKHAKLVALLSSGTFIMCDVLLSYNQRQRVPTRRTYKGRNDTAV